MRRLLIIVAVLLGAVAAGIAAVLMAVPAVGSTVPATPPLQCSKAYGDCQVTEYIHYRANGTVWIETCFEEAPVTEGHGGVLASVVDCYRP